MSAEGTDVAAMPQLDGWLDEARSAGARGVELVREHIVRHRHSLAMGLGGEPERDEKIRLIARVYLEGGREAGFTLNDPTPRRVTGALQRALKQARSAPEDPFAGPTQRLGINSRGLGIEDRRYRFVDAEARNEVLQLNQAACQGVEGVDVLDIDYEDVLTRRHCTSTTANEGASTATRYRVRMRVRDRLTGRELDETSAARNFSHVGSLPYGAELAKRLAALREPGTAPDGPVPLVLESRVAAWILERLAPAFSAERVEAGTTFVAGRMEDRLAGPRVHLIDDPGLHGGLRTRAFDERGVPPSPVAILREGMASGLFQSPETARRADIRPTGHVVGGELVPTNLILRAGNRSRTQMLSEVPVCLSYDRLEGELDTRTGRVHAWGPAFVLERGRPKGSLDRVEFDTNIVDLLMQVQEVAADQERHGAVDCATILLREAPLRW